MSNFMERILMAMNAFNFVIVIFISRHGQVFDLCCKQVFQLVYFSVFFISCVWTALFGLWVQLLLSNVSLDLCYMFLVYIYGFHVGMLNE